MQDRADVMCEWTRDEVDYFCRWYPEILVYNLRLRMNFIFGNLRSETHLENKAIYWKVYKPGQRRCIRWTKEEDEFLEENTWRFSDKHLWRLISGVSGNDRTLAAVRYRLGNMRNPARNNMGQHI